MVPREQWCSDPLPGYQLRGPLRAIVVHHTDRASEQVADLHAELAYAREIRRFHLERGWLDIGYHFLVMPSGRIFVGRPSWAIGAHVRAHNRGTIGVALAGDFQVEYPTAAALASIDSVRRVVPGARRVPLVAHGDLAEVTCPGENLYRAVSALRSTGEADATAAAPELAAAAAGSGRR